MGMGGKRKAIFRLCVCVFLWWAVEIKNNVYSRFCLNVLTSSDGLILHWVLLVVRLGCVLRRSVYILILCRMAEKGGQIVPESVLKKQKRAEEWALVKKQEVAALKEKKAANRKLIFNRAKEYAKEYAAQVLLESIAICIADMGCIIHGR